MFSLSVSSHFDAAHYLRGYLGPCANLHGHSWKYTVTIEGPVLDSQGMLFDFKEIKNVMKEMVESKYDHKCLNDTIDFRNVNPTAENLAETIYETLSTNIAIYHTYFRIVEVSVNESDDCKATYKGKNVWQENYSTTQ